MPRLALLLRLLLALWVWAIALHVKVHPALAGLDHSGAFAFNHAHVRGMVFGRDVAFTYGPLSFLTLPMPIGHNLEQGFLFQLLVWAIFSAVTAWFFFSRRRPLACVLLFALSFYLGCDAFRVFGYAGPDMFLVYLGLLLLAGALAGRRWILWYAASAAVCTLVFFVKFSSAATLAGAMAFFSAALFVSDPPKARRSACILAAVPVAVYLVHIVCYGSPAWLWRYMRVAMEMSAGYGVTMSEGNDTSGLVTAIVLLIVWLLATFILYRRRVTSWSLAFACLAPLFLEFKHSFAREAGHIEIFFMFVPLLFGLVALFTDAGRKDLWYVAAAALVPAAIWYPRESAHVRALAHPLSPFRNLHFLREALHLSDLRRSLEQVSAQGMAEDRLPPALLARIGRAPVAVFPMECSYAGANDIEMRPFPIFQAYQAYTPYLDGWNAAFLEDSRTAPQFILFDWDTVDGRHPLLDVPATAVSMFRHYELDGSYGRHMLLRRRAAPRFGSLRLLERREARLAEPVRLPAGDHPLAARIHLSWNVTGRLLKFFFRVPEVRLVASTSTGSVVNVRVPPEVMEDGVPNFLPFDMEAARTLYGGAASGRIDALLIGGPGRALSGACGRSRNLRSARIYAAAGGSAARLAGAAGPGNSRYLAHRDAERHRGGRLCAGHCAGYARLRAHPGLGRAARASGGRRDGRARREAVSGGVRPAAARYRRAVSRRPGARLRIRMERAGVEPGQGVARTGGENSHARRLRLL